MNYKYKVGDKVVALPYDEVYTIITVDVNDDELPYQVNEDASPDWFKEEELELYEVYNSPLGKALK